MGRNDGDEHQEPAQIDVDRLIGFSFWLCYQLLNIAFLRETTAIDVAWLEATISTAG